MARMSAANQKKITDKVIFKLKNYMAILKSKRKSFKEQEREGTWSNQVKKCCSYLVETGTGAGVSKHRGRQQLNLPQAWWGCAQCQNASAQGSK